MTGLARRLARTEPFVRRLLEGASVLLLGAIALVCFVEVVLRYGFGESFAWYDEFAGYLLVWLTFTGTVLAEADGRHIGMGAASAGLGRRGRRRREIAVRLLMVAIHLVLLGYGAQLVARFWTERAITLPIPMGSIYLVLPLSAAAMLWVEGVRLAALAAETGD